jgi:small conductance mechanosensitive channel
MSIINELIITYGSKIILALITLFVGLKIIKFIMKLITKKFEKANIDMSLRPFLISIMSVVMKILLGISIASMLGVQMTSFIAIIGAAGLAVGLALQGSLSNFAGGVLILLLKPFNVGDYIEAAGFSGTVQEIQIFYTILNTPDNNKVIVPNSNLSNSGTINYSANPTRRLNLKFGVSYENDILKVKNILIKIAKDHRQILNEPAPQVLLGEHGDSALVFYLRAWTKIEDYWNVYFEIMETVKLEFDKEDINIPYPQMDVHMIKN